MRRDACKQHNNKLWGGNVIKQYNVVSSTMVCGVIRQHLLMLWGEIWPFEGGRRFGASYAKILISNKPGWQVTMELRLGGKNAILCREECRHNSQHRKKGRRNARGKEAITIKNKRMQN